MTFPEIKTRIRKTDRQNVSMVGLDTSNMYADGSFRDCLNITTDEYPYIKTRKRLIRKYGPYSGAGAQVFVWNYIFRIDKSNTNVWYSLTEDSSPILLGKLSNVSKPAKASKFPKQFVVAGNKICIFPDAVYIDLDQSTLSLKRMGRELYYVADTSHLFYNNSNDNLAVIMLVGNSNVDLRKKLEGITPGMKIHITGTPDPTDEKDYEVRSIIKDRIYLKGQWTKGGTTSADKLSPNYRIQRWSEYSEDIDETRVVPDLDFVCMKDNKIYGCSSKYQTIYTSSQGDPLDFGTYDGVATDAYAVAVGSPGEFTGIAQVGSSICFFKEETVHKLMGAYPAEYYLYQYETLGVAQDCDGTVQTIDGAAYYFSNYGFTRFTGSEAVLVSEALNKVIKNGPDSDYDGKHYWLSCSSGVYVFDLQHKIWTKFYNENAVGIQHKGKKTYISINDYVWLVDDNELYDITEWYIEFNPYRERTQNGYTFEKKRYVKFIFDIDLPKGSSFVLSISEDGTKYTERRKLTGEKKSVVSLTISTKRLDKVFLKLSGKGPMTIYQMEREFLTSGSER